MRLRRSGGIGVAEALFLVLLLAPPALRIAWDHGPLRGWVGASSSDSSSPESPAQGERAERLRAELAQTRDQLRAAQALFESLRSASSALVESVSEPGSHYAGRFRLFNADVVSFSDPSPERHVLWVSMPGFEAGLRDLEEESRGLSAGLRRPGAAEDRRAVEPPDRYSPDSHAGVVSGKRLVGRLVPSPFGFSIARVQLLLDPLFRVRFRAGNSTGMLWGTGLRDEDGQALLEVHHVIHTREIPRPQGDAGPSEEGDAGPSEEGDAGPELALAAGVEVVTAGNDGVFPPGILIGAMVGGEDAARVGGKAYVRSALDPASLEHVVVVIDRARVQYAALPNGEDR